MAHEIPQQNIEGVIIAEYPAIDIWRYMLSEGVSIEYIKECVEKHIEGLLVMIPGTDKVGKVIEDCRAFF